MTEDEAKTKWCPHVRHTALPMSNGDAAVYDNRSSEVAFHVAGCCIASECMAWRWSMEPNPAYVEQANIWPDTRQPQQKQPMLPGKQRGHCGLAGRP